ncbi:TlpA family protein disulfide reductase [Cryptosporangium aurantiacum]|uniref:Thiol-disulfide isomerase or thioredoxin n=1 Tax=Cryptosporangium aurantiacum TaxID=134849 RepID=A0A1M7NIS7_9ACTN|nr:TlpA disulfide reductase family protein [Cryptosporangium aurantiacum]SHN03602.1 Thiol-disulfide isomerase or thioredoxin [Cryptosporangium aurantiacum]
MSTRFRLAAVAVSLALVAGCNGGDAEEPATAASTGAASFRGSGFAACPAPTGSPRADSPLADVPALPCMDGSGSTVTVGAPTGRPLVLNLWGSWCPPCGEELPAFVRLSRTAGDRLTVVGVNTSDDAKRAVAAAGDLDVTFANVFDRGERVRKALSVNALPATAFVAADGRVVHVYRGTPLTDTTLRALVRQHLGVQVE